MTSDLKLLKDELEKFAEIQTRFGNAGAIAGLVVAEALHRVLTRKVTAQHEETGRMWEGSLDQLPPGYSAVETRTARRERTEEAAFNLGVLRTESPVEPGRGRKCCGCVDDEAYKFSECFCLCHTANNQG